MDTLLGVGQPPVSLPAPRVLGYETIKSSQIGSYLRPIMGYSEEDVRNFLARPKTEDLIAKAQDVKQGVKQPS